MSLMPTTETPTSVVITVGRETITAVAAEMTTATAVVAVEVMLRINRGKTTSSNSGNPLLRHNSGSTHNRVRGLPSSGQLHRAHTLPVAILNAQP